MHYKGIFSKGDSLTQKVSYKHTHYCFR